MLGRKHAVQRLVPVRRLLRLGIDGIALTNESGEGAVLVTSSPRRTEGAV